MSTAEFAQILMNFPNEIARGLKMKSAVYVLDHFDCAPAEIGRAASLCLKTSPFIVASQNDRVFLSMFKVKKFVGLSAERSIEYKSRNFIIIPDANAEVGADDLKGCPGFICQFARICDTLAHTRGNMVVGTPNLNLRSKIDATRTSENEIELANLIGAIARAGNDRLSPELANDLVEQHFAVRIVSRKPVGS
jgi:hypothetical protein